jgi:predicted DNA-binding transcriptional regulator AlpA
MRHKTSSSVNAAERNADSAAADASNVTSSVRRFNGRPASRAEHESPGPTALERELRETAASVAEQVLSALLGRNFSARIRLLNLDQVCEATGLRRSTISRLVAQGKFPRPQKNLGKNLWRECTLVAWAEANDPN